MRQVVLDTETTGIGEGHRILEIGCVEVIERKLTGRHYHRYIDPQRDIDPEAQAVHGISLEWLREQNAPDFRQIAQEFREFIAGAELIIHNAAFDIGMMDAEFKRLGLPLTLTFCSVLDTLKLARELHPGARASLDALCKRYDIDNSHRELHGALLDAEILADVYLMMTGGQTALLLADEENEDQEEIDLDFLPDLSEVGELPLVLASEAEIAAHNTMLDLVDKKSGAAIWRRQTGESELL
jgi:DNA polymerase III subunit epsilon